MGWLNLKRREGEKIKVETPIGDLWISIDRVRGKTVNVGLHGNPEAFSYIRGEDVSEGNGPAVVSRDGS